MSALVTPPAVLGAPHLAARMSAAVEAGQSVQITVSGAVAEIPSAIAAQIVDLLDASNDGTRVVVAPYDLAVGTERAAELLGVSRQWLVTILDRGDLPMQKTGNKRRIYLGDLIAYRRTHGRHRHPVDQAVVIPAPEVEVESPREVRSTVSSRSSTPPTDWARNGGPTNTVVELPFRLYWSDDNNRFDLTNRARLRSMYQTVLTVGTAEDVRTFINQDLLLDVWPDLWLSRFVHENWDAWIEQQAHAAF